MEIKILRIAPDTVSCYNGEVETQCLKAKWTSAQEEWEVFEGSIKGFVYEPGYSYILRVRPADRMHLVADVASKDWILIKMIEKQKVCADHLSEEEIISILDSKGLILKPEGLTEDEISEASLQTPKAILDSEKCIWTVTSSMYESITYEEADCIDENGCIPEVILTVEVNARTADVLDLSKQRILHPNNFD